ncbi:MAG TPA: integrase arm-type DNA-binding domain-containing protein [Nitrobacter sp.]|nr:integrase arm-type DNA-binding domain-containing protein [Nitrobacter sp.]
MGTLTALQIKNAKAGERLLDGDGLRLEVDAKGRGRWFFRYTSPVTRKERLAGFGPLKNVSLAEARELAAAARAKIRKGIDPLEAKRIEREAAKVKERRTVTFQQYATTYIDQHESAWKNAVHRRGWRSSLRDHAMPHIGHMAVADIGTDDVLRVLRPIWDTKKETARAVRQRVEVILAAAKVEGLRSGENPAQWKGHLEFLLPRHKRTQRHFDALPYVEAPAFWQSLAADASPNASLVRWTILTCTRYSEAANADWSEIDKAARTWTIPGRRMKGGKDHAIPLSHAAFAVLSESHTTSGLIFPSMRSGKKTSDVALAKVIRRHTVTPVTLHGWRSTFRDWSGDMTSHAREVAEGCLAHAVGSAVEQAYRRGSAIEKRRALLEAWSGFLKTGLSPLNQAVA